MLSWVQGFVQLYHLTLETAYVVHFPLYLGSF